MILRERYEKTPVAGEVSWNTISDLRGEIKQIVVNPSASNTSYDFSITDDANAVVYQKKGLVGTNTDDSKIGAFGIYTMNISNASTSDNAFTITLIWDEKLTN